VALASLARVTAWSAVFWGAFSSASLYLGQWLARPLADDHTLTGLVMGFGAGTLLSAIAYELIPETSLEHGVGVGISFAIGAVTYYVADRIVDGGGGEDRQEIDQAQVGSGGSGIAMFLGALLDGVPEAFILGITLALGGSINVAFVAAVFVSNIPQGVAGTTSLQAAGYTDRRIFRMWTALTAACALVAWLGYLVANRYHVEGLYSQAFAGGAVLTMLADSMFPEAFEHGGRSVGLLVVAGYLVAAVLTIAS
jgi:ZIP family zinc transporter